MKVGVGGWGVKLTAPPQKKTTLKKPSLIRVKNCAVGNESSSFVSEKNNMSRLGLISDHKKSNLFRLELMLSSPIVGGFGFSFFILVKAFKFYFSGRSTL